MPSPSGTYHRAIRCGRPFGPMVPIVITICSSRNARTSSSDIRIWSRREAMRANLPVRLVLAACEAGERLGALEDGGPRLLRLEHDRVAAEAQDLVDEPVRALEGKLDDDRPVLQLFDHALVLARPARTL